MIMLRNSKKKFGVLATRLSRRFLPVSTEKNNPEFLLPEKLTNFSELLLADSGRVESDFLELGLTLQKTHQDASEMIRYVFDSVAEFNGNKEEGMLKTIDRIVHDALADLQSCCDKVTRDAAYFGKSVGLMENLYGICSRIDNMVLELRMVGLNIGIESVRSSNARELFGLTAMEVRKLTEKIIGITGDIRNNAAHTSKTHQTAHVEISKDIQRMSAVADQMKTTVREVTEKIKNLVELSASVLNSVGKRSQEISDEIGQVVMRIQFHDNMHQRITHITEAILDAVRLISSSDSESDEKEVRNRCMGDAHAVISLQKAQLMKVIDEVADAHSEIIGAFDNILSQVAGMENKLFSIETESSSDEPRLKSDSPSSDPSSSDEISEDGIKNAKQLFLTLNDTVDRFQDFLKQGKKLHVRMKEIFDKASLSAENLSTCAAGVRQINLEIHLLSLNAIVKATHIGSEGLALEVLAHAVKGLSDQSNDFVTRIDSLVKKIVEASQIGSNSKSELSSSDSCVNQTMLTRDASIMQYYDSLASVSKNAAHRATSLIESVSVTRSKLVFLDELKIRLSGHLQTLETYESLLQPFAENQSSSSTGEIEGIKIRYTMDQERMVHHQNFESDVIPPHIENTSKSDESLIGIELFEADISPQNSFDSAEAEMEEDMGANVELF